MYPSVKCFPMTTRALRASCEDWRMHSNATRRLSAGRPGIDIRRTREHPQSLGRGFYIILVDTTIMLYDTRDDWLELTLGIAWMAPPKLTVNAAVEVACWCPQDHNMHQVRAAQWHAVNSRELVEAFAAGTAMLVDVLATGPFDPLPWRAQAGLPDAPKPDGD
jgi:hypothetical protein